MTLRSRWSDLDRPPLDAAALRRALLIGPAGCGPPSTSSPRPGRPTPTWSAGPPGGAAEGTVLVAEEQTAGRGRLDRALDRAGPLRALPVRAAAPGLAARRRPGAGRPVGLAAAAGRGRRRHGGLARAAGRGHRAQVAQRPAGHRRRRGAQDGGILAERAGDDRCGDRHRPERHAARGRAARCPPPPRWRWPGHRCTDRDPLLRARAALARPSGTDPGARPAATRTLCRLQEAYAAGCATLGRTVRAELPGGRELVGEAVAIDGDGRLVIAGGRSASSRWARATSFTSDRRAAGCRIAGVSVSYGTPAVSLTRRYPGACPGTRAG